jgi:cholesterol oxidase
MEDLKPTERYDAVVIGSGFGGSVTTYRLAEAGQRVCLLERGRAYPPGSFPRDPGGMARNFWDPSSGLYGMFDVWSFSGLEGLVSSGLGGGSLIYANVLLRKPEEWFLREYRRGGGHEWWPITRADLDPHYDAVEKVLNAQTYPFHAAPYASTTKTRAMQQAAERLGREWLLPNLAVTFANPGRPPRPGEVIEGGEDNLHGAPRMTCRLCGECDIGCNDGAKNTLDYNYLTKAQKAGAEIRTLSEVLRIEPWRDGYCISGVTHQPDSVPAEVPFTVGADRVILAAGTFGSPYLLLRNRAAFPALSPALGSQFCGNGDLLTFITRARDQDGDGTRPRGLNSSRGPVITSAIRVPDGVEGNGARGRGFYVEDGGNPAFLSWTLEATSTPALAWRTASFFLRRLWAHQRGDPQSNYSSQLASLINPGDLASTFLPLLAMGRDVPDGVMSLRDGDLEVNWSTRTSKEYFQGVEETVGGIAKALGGRYLNTPLWLFKHVITVHPLGGCPMGRNEKEGVVDAYGQVFGHPGLYVADGSTMPGPVGPNPSLTIAAFADRVADGILSA